MSTISSPTALKAVAVSTSEIDLQWNAPINTDGIGGYRIYRNNVLIANVYGTPSSTGSGANLRAVLFSDGESFNVKATKIGQIKDFRVLNRGIGYIETPNVSLKVYDLAVTTPSGSILENDIVYQGTNISATTFRATVDSYANNLLRVFNYSGVPNNSLDLIVYKPTSTNITLQITSNTKYGDGQARATAEFLNGVIKYDGYYLNTDGHLSSDKRLQDSKKYHNYSYSLDSQINSTRYKKTILDVVHPSGMELLSTYSIKDDKPTYEQTSVNLYSEISTSDILINNCSVDYDSTTVTGVDEKFTVVSSVDDLIVINTANTNRQFTKLITAIDSNNSLNIESSCIFIGEGRAKTNTGNAIIKISGNSNILPAFIDTSDKIIIDGLTKSIVSISGNTITLDSNTGFTDKSNLVYQVSPKFDFVDYKIVRTGLY